MAGDELTGRCVLLAEDEMVVAMELETALQAAGAEVIGPCTTVDATLNSIDRSTRLDVAILDIKLRGGFAYAVADVLKRRGVPILFVTAYSHAEIRSDYQDVPYLGKPISVARITDTVARLAQSHH